MACNTCILPLIKQRDLGNATTFSLSHSFLYSPPAPLSPLPPPATSPVSQSPLSVPPPPPPHIPLSACLIPVPPSVLPLPYAPLLAFPAVPLSAPFLLNSTIPYLSFLHPKAPLMTEIWM